MADFNNLALTANGFKALLAAQAGTTLTLTKIGMGSGSTTSSTVSLTSMVTPEVMMPISEKKIDEEAGLMTIVAKMTNEDIMEGFYWRETGLFYEDSEGNDVLFAYACVVDDQYDYVPAYSDQRYVKHVRIANILTDAADIVIKENEGLLYVDILTYEEFLEGYGEHVKKSEEHINDTNNPHKVTAKDLGLDNALTGSINDQTPTYEESEEISELSSGEKISTAFGKIATAIKSLISHIGNKSNPHEVTASQVGLGNVPNVATNNQTPTYTVATTLKTLVSGEKISVAFGKIAKGISDLISHLANTENPHEVTADQVGAVPNSNIVNNFATTESGYVADARAVKNLYDKMASLQKAAITANGSLNSLSLAAATITQLALDTILANYTGYYASGSSYVFELTDDGGIVCPSSGIVLVTGCVYISGTSGTQTNKSCFITRKAKRDNVITEEEICSQLIRDMGGSGGLFAGSKIVAVQDGDIFYLKARSSVAATCYPNNAATYLSITYL